VLFLILCCLQKREEPPNSLGIVTDYGLDDLMIRVRISEGAGNFPLRYRVQTGSGAHPASCPKVTGDYFPEVIAAVA
jgi:hypothetical protein